MNRYAWSAVGVILLHVLVFTLVICMGRCAQVEVR